MDNPKTQSRASKYIKQFWNGERIPSAEGKFSIICCALAAVHALLILMFYILGIPLMSIYNIFSAGYYGFTCRKMVKAGEYSKVFYRSYFEILIFSSFTTLLIGWDWGFMLYVIAISPVSYFITYTLPTKRKRTMTRPVSFSILAMIVYVTIRGITYSYPALAAVSISDTLVRFVSQCNSVITFVSITLFAILFSLEITNKEKELEKQNGKLTDMSSIDPLTGLLNRRSMSTYLEEAVASVKSTGALFSLAIGDIDNFKMVNDIHGHNVGDDVLIMVANTIKETLPENAVLCRWGGEEFLILLPLVEVDAVPIIESVRYAITKVSTKVEKPEGNIDLGVTMTFGVSQYIHGFSIDKIISIADENLYKGKEHGKNRVVHSKTVVL